MENNIDNVSGTTERLGSFFKDKIFFIPNYQRTYAWEYENWNDLWVDILDGIKNDVLHYWGTITLKSTGAIYKPMPSSSLHEYQVIDGQQRLTTLSILLLAISKRGDPGVFNLYIKDGKFYKVNLGSLNESFYKDLVDGTDNTDKNISEIRTNKRLKDAFEFFFNRINSDNINEVVSYLVDKTFMLKFSINDDALAVQSFVCLNDRGRDLTLLEKTKGLLIFYCSRYLQENYSYLTSKINLIFAEIYPSYDIIKNKAEKLSIDYLNSNNFTENEFLRIFYHYFTNKAIQDYKLNDKVAYDTRASAKVAYDFIKISLDKLSATPLELDRFINELLDQFKICANAFVECLNDIDSNPLSKKLFLFNGLSASIYPLIISLKAVNLLNDDFIKLIEILDIRVFKIAGKDRIKWFYEIISQIRIEPVSEVIFQKIKYYIDSWANDSEVRRLLLGQNVYGFDYTKYLLWEYQSTFQPGFNDLDIDKYKELSKEHVFAQAPVITFPALGFDSEDDYKFSLNLIGNICLLESYLQKHKDIDNKPPVIKATVYESNALVSMPETRMLGAQINQFGFSKDDIISRGQKIIDFCLMHWK